MVQVHVLARVWGFESPLRHQYYIFNSLKRLLLAVLLFAGNNWFRLALAGDRWSSAASAKLRSHRNFRGAYVANKIAVVYQHVKINNKWTFQKAPPCVGAFCPTVPITSAGMRALESEWSVWAPIRSSHQCRGEHRRTSTSLHQDPFNGSSSQDGLAPLGLVSTVR